MEAGVVSFGILFLLIFSGIPVAFALLMTSLLVGYFLVGSSFFYVLIFAAWSTMNEPIYLAIPLFVLLASILQYSGIASDIYDVMYKWVGSIRGGLLIGTIGACTLLAALTGLGSSGVALIGLLGYEEMVKRKYDRQMILGVIPASSALGVLIPPSVLMVILSGYTGISLGPLMISGVIPGLVIAIAFVIYVLIRCTIDPQLAPAFIGGHRSFWRERISSLLKVTPPLLIIIIMLGSIYVGMATPTESAALGALSVLILSLMRKRLTFNLFFESLTSTMSVTVMIAWLLIGGSAFATLLSSAGVSPFVQSLFDQMDMGTEGTIIVMLCVVLVLGMFMDGAAITVILVPIFWPIIRTLDASEMWFAVMYIMALVVGYTSPPFGMNLFVMQGVLPVSTGVSTREIFRAAIPFCLLMVGVMAICFVFPALGQLGVDP